MLANLLQEFFEFFEFFKGWMMHSGCIFASVVNKIVNV